MPDPQFLEPLFKKQKEIRQKKEAAIREEYESKKQQEKLEEEYRLKQLEAEELEEIRIAEGLKREELGALQVNEETQNMDSLENQTENQKSGAEIIAGPSYTREYLEQKRSENMMVPASVFKAQINKDKENNDKEILKEEIDSQQRKIQSEENGDFKDVGNIENGKNTNYQNIDSKKYQRQLVEDEIDVPKPQFGLLLGDEDDEDSEGFMSEDSNTSKRIQKENVNKKPKEDVDNLLMELEMMSKGRM